jgi:hypothetical protein
VTSTDTATRRTPEVDDGGGGYAVKANDSSSTGLTARKEHYLETTSDSTALMVAGALDSFLGIVKEGDIVHVRTVDGGGDTVTDWSLRVLTADTSVTAEVIQEVGLMEFDSAGNLLTSMATLLADERYPGSEETISDISTGGIVTFSVADYDDGDQGVILNSDNSADGTYTVVKTDTTHCTLLDSDGDAVTFGSQGTTGTMTFTHLSRGSSKDKEQEGVTIQTMLDDVSATGNSSLINSPAGLLSFECKDVHDTSGAVSATVSIYGTNETTIPSVNSGTVLKTFSLSGTTEVRDTDTLQHRFRNIYAVISAIGSANEGVTLTVSS